MKYVKQLRFMSLFMIGCLAFTQAQAHGVKHFFENFRENLMFRPYVGGDAQGRHTKYKYDYGKGFVSPHAFQGNVFIGAQFHPNLTLELGYSHTARRTKVRKVSEVGDSLPGPDQPFDGDDSCVATTRSDVETINANLQLLLPICPISKKLEAILNFGISYSHPSLRVHVTDFVMNGMDVGEGPVRSDVKHKTLTRLGGGLQYRFTDHIGVRTLLLWENTSRFKFDRIDGALTLSYRPKDTFIYSLGAFFRF